MRELTCKRCGERMDESEFGSRLRADGRVVRKAVCRRCARERRKSADAARRLSYYKGQSREVVDALMANAVETVKTHEPYYKQRRDAEVVAWEI